MAEFGWVVRDDESKAVHEEGITAVDVARGMLAGAV
jgi:hypothetical protein